MSMTAQRSSATLHDEPDDFRGQAAAMGAGALLVLIGALGFIPGVTQHVAFKAGERFSGPESHAMLFGLFQTSVLANLVFLGLGVLGGVSGFFALTSKLFFFVVAVVFTFFGIYGLSIDRSGSANFLPMNGADNWFHLGIAVVALVVGLIVSAVRPRQHDADVGR